MTTLLHLSDPHFGTERPRVVEALAQLAREQKPDLVVLSGDITQRARRKQFQAARIFVDALGAPHRIVIPGNHDIPLFNVWARVFFPYANHRREFGQDLEPSFESEHLLVVAVNTTRTRRHKDGEVSPQQIERVAARLQRAAPGQIRIVVTHQPIAVLRAQDVSNLLHGHEAAIREWAKAGADFILGGHIHLPYLLPLHERLPDLPRKLWVLQAGTALSWRIRYEADNSVNVIRYPGAGTSERRAIVERWDYIETAQCFRAEDRQELILSSASHAN